MKALIFVATLYTFLGSISASSLNDKTFGIGNVLNQLKTSSKHHAFQQDLEDELTGDDDEDIFAKVMTKVILSSVAEDGDDGEGSIMADIMSSNEEKAVAHLQLLRGLIRASRTPLGQCVTQSLRTRLCNRRG